MNRFIIANAHDCIGCRACEVACVMSHNMSSYPDKAEDFHPRIKVIKGIEHTTAVLCRQCEDAPCARVCPTHALIRRDDSIQLIKERCIGCKSCALACPFGAMDIVSESVPYNAFTRVFASKCDLCSGHDEGQACVNACPTQAPHLFNSKTLTTSIDDKRRTTASRGIEPVVPFPSAVNRVTHLLATLPRRPRVDAEKAALELRKTTFMETYRPVSTEQMTMQADRCLSCSKHAVCEWTCPLHNNIPELLRLAKTGRILEAVELSHCTSSLPEVCGRVCPQDRLCEGSCTLNGKYGSVTVGNIERYITDTAIEMGWAPDLSHVISSGKRVAVIGAGPAGLGCADILARHGVQAVVYDRHPEIGGLLTFGIPAFKLDKDVLITRRRLFTQMGIEFRLNTEVGKDIALHQLLDEFDAIFIGVGTYTSMKAGLKNEDAPGVFDALPFLIANTKHEMGLPELPDEPYINMKGKRVVVLGGGDTAMDCLRTSLRQGAAKVTCAYRRDEENMPGSKKEVKNSREEGADFMFNVQPQHIQLGLQGEVIGISLIRTVLSEPDGSGRRRPRPVPGSEFLLEADAVIMAFGFSAHAMPWLDEADIHLSDRGLIKASASSRYPYQTSHSKIFAGGDVVRGADLVVTAMADGRKAALGIIDSLGISVQNQQFIQSRNGGGDESIHTC